MQDWYSFKGETKEFYGIDMSVLEVCLVKKSGTTDAKYRGERERRGARQFVRLPLSLPYACIYSLIRGGVPATKSCKSCINRRGFSLEARLDGSGDAGITIIVLGNDVCCTPHLLAL